MVTGRKRVWWGLVGTLLVTVITVVSTSMVLALKDGNKIPPNSSVAGIYVGGLSHEEARSRLALGLPDRVSPNVVFKAAGKTFTMPYEKCNIQFDLDGSLARCHSNQGAWLEGIIFHSVIRGKSQDYPVAFKWEAGKLYEVIEEIRPQFELKAKDARLILQDDCLEYIPHQPGRQVDAPKTVHRWEQALRTGKLGPVEVAFTETRPRVEINDIRNVKDVLGVYVTTFNPSQKDRTTNLRLAASSLNGTIVMPGQVFSLDAALGPRREENGYRKAAVFSNNRVIQDWGGGICQVATTLYNAVLQAGLEIVERRPHSQPITYVPLGQDATIVANMYDLKFRNNTDTPVLIAMSLRDNQLMAQIFGCQTDPNKVIRLVTEREEIQPRVIIKSRPDVPKGARIIKEKGRKGYRVKTYRVVCKNGLEVQKTLLSEDYYRPVNTVIFVGPNYEGVTK